HPGDHEGPGLWADRCDQPGAAVTAEMGGAGGAAGSRAVGSTAAGALAGSLGFATVAAHHVLCAARRHGADDERPYAQTQSPGTVGPTCTGHAAVRLDRVIGCSGGDTGVDGGTALFA